MGECPKTRPIKLRRPPARASEEFLSTIAQGMWAEERMREAINEVPQLLAIKYGPSRYNHELISNKQNWQRYVSWLYQQMSIYGKRPDLLVFRRDEYSRDFPSDLSEISEESIQHIVRKAIVGIECRSSSYFYDEYVSSRKREGAEKELSITVKDEDLERVNQWIKTYCGRIPIYYVQIFFDKAFALEYDKILHIIRQAKQMKLLEGRIKIANYRHKMEKKTGKWTHYIGVTHGKICAIALESPTLDSEVIKSWNGKVMAIRMPKGGKYRLTDEFIRELLSI